ncbi:hypothetical protein BKA69DRAFT_1125748 [Paraphysoderma sedebokerense]|nr:hypothetical protein BKA69DRAFT_1125748 [Paraphysoderma sedebokerense]
MSSMKSSKTDLLYGTNVILPALHMNRRKCVKLFLQEGQQSLLRFKKNEDIARIVRYAESKGIPVQLIRKRKLDNMSANRPHQGVVLCAEQLTPLKITSLTDMEKKGDGTEQYFAKMNDRDVLDQLQDPQNLGAIIRSAYFYGVDGVITTTENTARLGPTVSKASSGALELIDVFGVNDTADFVRRAQQSNWQILGAHIPYSFADIDISAFKHQYKPPPALPFKLPTLSDSSPESSNVANTESSPQPSETGTSTVKNEDSDSLGSPKTDPSPNSPPTPTAITQSPTLLIIGSEHDGISKDLKFYIDKYVYVPRKSLPIEWETIEEELIDQERPIAPTDSDPESKPSPKVQFSKVSKYPILSPREVGKPIHDYLETYVDSLNVSVATGVVLSWLIGVMESNVAGSVSGGAVMVVENYRKGKKVWIRDTSEQDEED